MSPFIDVISCYDLLNELVKLCDLYTLGHLVTVNKQTLSIMSNDKIWQTLYRKHLKNVPHIDMQSTWLASFGFNYSLINDTVQNLVKDFCLITDSPFINTSMIKTEIRDSIIAFMSKSDWKLTRQSFNKLYTRVRGVLAFLNGTKNIKYKITIARDNKQIKQRLMSLHTAFGYDVSRV